MISQHRGYRGKSMLTSDELVEAQTFIEKIFGGFIEAFGNDPVLAANFWVFPALIVNENKRKVFNTIGELIEYYATGFTRLKSLDYLYSEIKSHHIRFVNSGTAVFATTFVRMNVHGEKL